MSSTAAGWPAPVEPALRPDRPGYPSGIAPTTGTVAARPCSAVLSASKRPRPRWSVLTTAPTHPPRAQVIGDHRQPPQRNATAGHGGCQQGVAVVDHQATPGLAHR